MDLLSRMALVDPGSRRELVELQRDIGELSLTSGVISRTRKVDVMPDRPIRKSQSVRVTMTPDESAIYEQVAARFISRAPSESWGAAMAMMQALRLTASCIPAAIDYFSLDRPGRGFEADLDLSPDDRVPSAEDERQARITTVGRPLSRDSKFDALLQVFREQESGGTGPLPKSVVFAFFKPTLRYLSRRLHEVGVVHRIIHGDISIPDRERAIEEFVRDPAVRVLLSSEVGSEGVDLQVASTVVNYDLPWNPMVVEQRIGRLDRIGQQAKVISIVNLVLKGTVEDRVLLRLYERIDLFERTIGEIEDILGDQLESLALQYLRQELTPEEAEQQALQKADAFLQEQHQVAQLQAEADRLLAGDQGFLDEVEGLFGERRVPGPEELYRFLRHFLDDRFPGCGFPREMLHRSVEVRLQVAVASALLTQFPNDPDVKRFAAKVQAGHVAMTMDSDAYLRVGSAEFVSMHHCLVRLACVQMRRDAEALHRTFRLRVTGAEGVAPGEYVMGMVEFEISGIRPRVELTPIAIKVGGGQVLPPDSARRLFVASLDGGGMWEGAIEQGRAALEHSVERLRKEADRQRGQLTESEMTLGALRAARRRATKEGGLRHRLKIAKERLAMLQAQGAKEFAMRMARSRVQNEEARLQVFLSDPGAQTSAVVAPREVAVVHVLVEPA